MIGSVQLARLLKLPIFVVQKVLCHKQTGKQTNEVTYGGGAYLKMGVKIHFWSKLPRVHSLYYQMSAKLSFSWQSKFKLN